MAPFFFLKYHPEFVYTEPAEVSRGLTLARAP